MMGGPGGPRHLMMQETSKPVNVSATLKRLVAYLKPYAWVLGLVVITLVIVFPVEIAIFGVPALNCARRTLRHGGGELLRCRLGARRVPVHHAGQHGEDGPEQHDLTRVSLHASPPDSRWTVPPSARGPNSGRPLPRGRCCRSR